MTLVNENQKNITVSKIFILFFRKDCLNVNGFNEDFIGWGRDDSEFGARKIQKIIEDKVENIIIDKIMMKEKEVNLKAIKEHV